MRAASDPHPESNLFHSIDCREGIDSIEGVVVVVVVVEASVDTEVDTKADVDSITNSDVASDSEMGSEAPALIEKLLCF